MIQGLLLITVITESKDTLHQEWAEMQRKEKKYWLNFVNK